MPRTDYEIHPSYCHCPACREWEDYWEAWHAIQVLAAQDIELRHARPATDREWAEFMDAEWPRVKEGVTK
jgi:hypothetical protein